ncbi:alpha-galactosidase [Paracoccaceae bacterium GXU_MW_L88]
MRQYWRLDDAGWTLVLAGGEGLAEALYLGPRLPDGEDLAALDALSRRDVTGGMLDENPPLSLCPEARRSFPGQPGMVAYGADGALLAPVWAFERSEEYEEDRLALHYRAERLRLSFHFAVTYAGVLTAETALTSDAPIRLHWLAAPVLPVSGVYDDLIDTNGRWIGEFQLNRKPITPGIIQREARNGRSGHEHPPLAFLAGHGANNNSGQVLGLHYDWSGGHRMVLEELPDGRRQIQFGHTTGSEPVGTEFTTEKLSIAVSQSGLNGAGIAFQRQIRAALPPFRKPRPVHYNCWEAIYFDHDLASLKEIANRAADLGAERFVLDDGWFGKRDDDTSSLGDWDIDHRKWPDGLSPLIDHVQSLGMGFGLWFEPEMINESSDLYRAHPDWVLGPGDQITGRQQLCLDMSKPEVRRYLFDKISAVLSAHDIDYIKWDHNRLLPHPDAAQTRGIYALLDDLRAAFPEVEIESCASGGGRIDAGILTRCNRVWLSDSNDALERLRIQHDAALFLPGVATGSHVGPRVCHTSGRTLPMRLRAWVAAQRHMGFEMDPRELTEDEAATLKEVTAWWKANRDWMAEADILRLDADDPSVIAELQLAENGQRFVVFAGQAATSTQILPRPLRLAGLDPDARYEITLLPETNPLSRGKLALTDGSLTPTGQALMTAGITLPARFPETISIIEGTRL